MEAEIGLTMELKPNDTVFKPLCPKIQAISDRLPTLQYVNNSQYIDNSWNWGNTTNIIHTHVTAQPAPPKETEEQKKKREEEEASRRAMWIGGGILAGAVWFAVRTGKKCVAQYQACIRNNEVIDNWKQIDENRPIKNTLIQILHIKSAIDALNYSRIRNQFCLAIAGCIGGDTTFLGGFTVRPKLMNAGYFTLFTTAIVGIGVLAWHWDDSDTLNRYHKALMGDKFNRQNGWLLKAITELNGYTDELKLANPDTLQNPEIFQHTKPANSTSGTPSFQHIHTPGENPELDKAFEKLDDGRPPNNPIPTEPQNTPPPPEPAASLFTDRTYHASYQDPPSYESLFGTS